MSVSECEEGFTFHQRVAACVPLEPAPFQTVRNSKNEEWVWFPPLEDWFEEADIPDFVEGSTPPKGLPRVAREGIAAIIVDDRKHLT